jgi:adenylate kinase family enzyme
VPLDPIEETRRIAVVGTSGAGKSTFARDLAARIAAPHVELDALYWLPNWTGREPGEFRELVDRATAAERWVVDGNYQKVRDLVWQRATDLVWLDYSFPVVFSRALRRTVRRIVSGESVHNGNRETIRGAFFAWDGIPIWVLRTYWRRRRELPALLAEPDYSRLKVTILATPREADMFLDRFHQPTAASA